MSSKVTVSITQQSNYQFLVNFGNTIPELQADETAPLGSGEGPSPNQLLLAAVANCLSSSLFFALSKYKQDAGGITATATARIDRNQDKRLRVQDISVAIRLGKGSGEFTQLDRILAQFEDFCTVTQSVRDGIPITVHVTDSDGESL
tara:strand:- start:1142 stop:1582 length:441 start_codon:yes stop_codon:yes gene_type:complete